MLDVETGVMYKSVSPRNTPGAYTMAISFPSEHYLQNCDVNQLVEYAFDAQRHVTLMVNEPQTGADVYKDKAAYEADWNAVCAFKKLVKAELVRRMTMGPVVDETFVMAVLRAG